MKNRLPVAASLSIAVFAAWAMGQGCAKVTEDPGSTGSGGSGGSGGRGTISGGTGGSQSIPGCVGMCTDFPSDPIIDDGTPSDAPNGFSGNPPTSGGPCISEPEDGTLFPNNWLRPRVKFSGANGQLVQIRFHAANQQNDLVAYTNKDSWAMPKTIWTGVRVHQVDDDVTVTVWIKGGGASQVKFRTAPVGADGSMVFWATKPSEVGKEIDQMPVSAIVNDSELRGFAVGDESTVSALRLDQVQQISRQQSWSETRQVKCIGCHSATPNGDYVAFVDAWPWNAVIAGVKPGVQGNTLPDMQAGGLLDLNMPWASPLTFSAAHWTTGDRIGIVASSLVDSTQPWSTDNNKPAKLVWYDLESAMPAQTNGQTFPLNGSNFGVMAHDGDLGGGVAFPTWSHDGTKVLYCSTINGNLDGRLERGRTDLYTVDYNNRAGGSATAVPGASTVDREEYYPAWSPDDKLIAYTAVPVNDKMYANPNAELYIVEYGSPTAWRLRANDPPACTGKKSPGINNHWPKWAPQIRSYGSRKYYWIIFSSNRYDIPPVTTTYPKASNPTVFVSQLYVAPVAITENGVESYPAIYLWNQPTTTLNTTPAWESFQLPPVE